MSLFWCMCVCVCVCVFVCMCGSMSRWTVAEPTIQNLYHCQYFFYTDDVVRWNRLPDLHLQRVHSITKVSRDSKTQDTLLLPIAAVCVLQTQSRWSYLLPDVQRSATVQFQWLPHVHGTVCRHPSGMRRR